MNRWAVVFSTRRKVYEVALMSAGGGFRAPAGCVAVQLDITLEHAQGVCEMMNGDLERLTEEELEAAAEVLRRRGDA